MISTDNVIIQVTLLERALLIGAGMRGNSSLQQEFSSEATRIAEEILKAISIAGKFGRMAAVLLALLSIPLPSEAQFDFAKCKAPD